VLVTSTSQRYVAPWMALGNWFSPLDRHRAIKGPRAIQFCCSGLGVSGGGLT